MAGLDIDVQAIIAKTYPSRKRSEALCPATSAKIRLTYNRFRRKDASEPFGEPREEPR